MAWALRAAAANAVEWGETRKESKSCKNNDSYVSRTPSMTSFLLGTLKGLFSRLQAPIPALRASSTSQPLDQVAGSLWNLGQLNHVAIAVPDLEKAAAFYKNILGAQVDNINAAVMDLKTKKIRSLSEEVKIGAHGKPVIFLHPKDCGGVLVELEQA
ncbi:methylmalonyl-CoA epimerase, mitochondrial isoform X3 [Rhinopithecus roxellana]|uniref:methylmalonyl-CoA epimerase, mitochondrial isoform X3 n=1 Tax=Rhinopithecus roxellana TaxID=61622 RepID=UPI0005332D15|nr:methylmalonyl-CoA epimerase, mitochondrial isoform X3 [Rhinopithecus roxellana]XP_017721153.1 PREDICTED: methylmalonyl-CoA epimerase, mitochondrial isoform X4 [Rhinopithecus bieti]